MFPREKSLERQASEAVPQGGESRRKSPKERGPRREVWQTNRETKLMAQTENQKKIKAKSR